MLGDKFTNANALSMFLTGAGSDGGSQSDPAASLGNYRSSAHTEQIGFLVARPIPGISIELAAGDNGPGLGSLEAVNGNALRWTAPNGQPGLAVVISNGETRLLESDDEPTKFLIVKCYTDAELMGAATVKLVPVYNNVIGSTNVTDAERAAGETKLRCIAFKTMDSLYTVSNVSVYLGTLGTQQVSDTDQLPASGAGDVETTGTFTDWPTTGFCRITESDGTLREIIYYASRTDTVLTVPTAGRGLLGTSASTGAATDTLDAVPGVKIAKEDPVADAFSTASNENDVSAVSGLTWFTGISKGTGIIVDLMDYGDMFGVWIWLHVPAGQTVSASLENVLKWEFDVWNLKAGML